MRIIAKNSLVFFWELHAEAKAPLERWYEIAKASKWTSIRDVLNTFGSAKGINGERVRFEVHGGNYRMIVAFDFRRQIAFIKFLGTHREYDSIDAVTVSMF